MALAGRGHGRRGAATDAGDGLQPGSPNATHQDQRDAIAAAVTANQHSQGETESIGEIVVPGGRW